MNVSVNTKKVVIYILGFLMASIGVTSCATQIDDIPKRGYYSDNEVDYDLDNIVRPKIAVVSKIIETSVLVGFSWIDAPLNKVVLIKNGDFVCAVKFTSFNRENDQKQATSFHSGEESFKAEYDFLSSKIHHNKYELKKIKHKKLVLNAAIGIGRLAFQPGESIIRCGNAKLLWQYPTAIMLFGKDMETSFAPTKLTNLENVDLNDSKLTWYGYDEKRKMINIPILLH